MRNNSAVLSFYWTFLIKNRPTISDDPLNDYRIRVSKDYIIIMINCYYSLLYCGCIRNLTTYVIILRSERQTGVNTLCQCCITMFNK